MKGKEERKWEQDHPQASSPLHASRPLISLHSKLFFESESSLDQGESIYRTWGFGDCTIRVRVCEKHCDKHVIFMISCSNLVNVNMCDGIQPLIPYLMLTCDFGVDFVLDCLLHFLFFHLYNSRSTKRMYRPSRIHFLVLLSSGQSLL